MGFSTTIAIMFGTIILVSGLATIITINLLTITTQFEAFKEEYKLNEESSGEDIKIDNVEGNPTLGLLLLNVTNIGEQGIQIRDFPYIDVIIFYKKDGANQTAWIPYDPNGASTPYWRVYKVFFKGREGDLMNPLKLTNPTHGIWDPEETIELEIVLSGSVQEFYYVVIATPSGSIAYGVPS
ncbi:hypothetical protein J7K52_01040 [Candidatus Bathyarchaeota archaeon]|nr:hypothetical protein [Candidatus Bathyarchaeota archaeon]